MCGLVFKCCLFALALQHCYILFRYNVYYAILSHDPSSNRDNKIAKQASVNLNLQLCL